MLELFYFRVSLSQQLYPPTSANPQQKCRISARHPEPGSKQMQGSEVQLAFIVLMHLKMLINKNNKVFGTEADFELYCKRP